MIYKYSRFFIIVLCVIITLQTTIFAMDNGEQQLPQCQPEANPRLTELAQQEQDANTLLQETTGALLNNYLLDSFRLINRNIASPSYGTPEERAELETLFATIETTRKNLEQNQNEQLNEQITIGLQRAAANRENFEKDSLEQEKAHQIRLQQIRVQHEQEEANRQTQAVQANAEYQQQSKSSILLNRWVLGTLGLIVLCGGIFFAQNFAEPRSKF